MELTDCKVGQRVYVVEGPHDWCRHDGNDSLKAQYDAARYTTILGIDGDSIIVFKPIELGGYDVPCRQSGKIRSSGWRVNAEYLMLLPDLDPPKPYPHICGRCKGPARKVGQAIMCAKDKCRSKYDFKKKYKIPYVKPKSGNTPLCPTCNQPAYIVLGCVQDGIPSSTRCRNGHTWEHMWRRGEILKQTEIKYSTIRGTLIYDSLYEYNGATFIRISE